MRQSSRSLIGIVVVMCPPFPIEIRIQDLKSLVIIILQKIRYTAGDWAIIHSDQIDINPI